MNAHPSHLTGARLTTFLRRGYALDDGRARPFPYPEPKFVRMAETVTYLPEAFNSDGLYSNGGDALFRKIGAILAPDDAPPVKQAG